MQFIQTPEHIVKIGGKTVPTTGWRVTVGSYGTLATVSIATTPAMIKAAGVQLLDAGSGPDTMDITIMSSNGNGMEKLFGGGLDVSKLRLPADVYDITGRDWGAALVDTKKVIDYFNMTPSDIATEIATEFHLTPVVTASDIPAGLTSGDRDSNFFNTPKPIWSVLQFLARAVGFQCRVTPDKELYFGPPPDFGAPFTATYAGQPATTGANNKVNLLREVEFTHNPRRNKTFEVIVYSYHSLTLASPKSSESREPVSGTPGAINYLQAPIRATAGASGGGIGSAPAGKPIYTYYIDGLNKEQADAKAKSIADDIAKHEIVVQGVLDGTPALVPQMGLRLVEGRKGALEGFDRFSYLVTAVEHEFGMPGMSGGDGFVTHFTALLLPPAESELALFQ